MTMWMYYTFINAFMGFSKKMWTIHECVHRMALVVNAFMNVFTAYLMFEYIHERIHNLKNLWTSSTGEINVNEVPGFNSSKFHSIFHSSRAGTLPHICYTPILIHLFTVVVHKNQLFSNLYIQVCLSTLKFGDFFTYILPQIIFMSLAVQKRLNLLLL